MPSRGGPQFEEALRILQSKVAMSPDEYKKLSELARQKAFTVGGITRLDILQDLLNELQRTITEGQTLQDFKKAIQKRMAEKGDFKAIFIRRRLSGLMVGKKLILKKFEDVSK